MLIFLLSYAFYNNRFKKWQFVKGDISIKKRLLEKDNMYVS